MRMLHGSCKRLPTVTACNTPQMLPLLHALRFHNTPFCPPKAIKIGRENKRKKILFFFFGNNRKAGKRKKKEERRTKHIVKKTEKLYSLISILFWLEQVGLPHLVCLLYTYKTLLYLFARSNTIEPVPSKTNPL